MIYKTIEDAFSWVLFYDEPHVYINVDSGENLTSVTTLISKYKKEFDVEYWSNYKAQQLNMPKEEIIKEWDFLKLRGITQGSIFHDYMENRTHRKIKKETIPGSLKDEIEDNLTILKAQGDKFISENRNLKTIYSELVIGDRELKLGGMIDKLYYNETSNKVEIWDWKTDKELLFSSAYNKKLLSPIEHIDDCNYNKYSLQLSLYKYIFEKNTKIETGDSYIVWFNSNNDTYKILKIKNLINDIRRIV